MSASAAATDTALMSARGGDSGTPATASRAGDDELLLRRLSAEELHSALALEQASYPEDEAASEEALRYRQANAPEHFRGAFRQSAAGDRPTLVGFVVGTRCIEDGLSEESMSTHVASPEAKTLCVHSVVVNAEHRRRGIGRWMLRAYIEAEVASTNASRVYLMCKQHLVKFYEVRAVAAGTRVSTALIRYPALVLQECGFSYVRLSPVVHGADPWHEMALSLEERRRAAPVAVAD